MIYNCGDGLTQLHRRPQLLFCFPCLQIPETAAVVTWQRRKPGDAGSDCSEAAFLFCCQKGLPSTAKLVLYAANENVVRDSA